MKKKMIALALALAFVLTLALLDKTVVNPNPTTVNQSVTPGTSNQNTSLPKESTEPTYPPLALVRDRQDSDSEFSFNVQYVPEIVESSDDLPVLKWVCLVNFSKQVWTEEAACELNKMLADKSMPFRVQFVMLTSEADPDWFSRAEVLKYLKDADMIWGFLGSDELTDYLAPITDYVTGEKQPSLENAVIHEMDWFGTTVGDDIYGIRTYPVTPSSDGWQVKSEVFEKFDLTTEDFSREYWEMDEVFAKIYKANGNKPFLSYMTSIKGGYVGEVRTAFPRILANAVNCIYQPIGACFAIDHSTTNPTVVNVLDTERANNIWKAFQRYKAAGYVTKEQNYLVEAIYVDGYKPYIDSNGYVNIPVSPLNYSSYYTGHYANGIIATSQNKEEAVSLLNLIAEDETFRKQLLFGKEGRDYTFTNGMYSAVRREDGAYYRMNFLSMHSYFDKLTERENSWMATYEGKTRMETYCENMDYVSSYDYPVAFDYSEINKELDTLGAALADFLYPYTNLTEDKYQIKLQKVKDAGADRILEELQRQLDTWLEENPNWDP